MDVLGLPDNNEIKSCILLPIVYYQQNGPSSGSELGRHASDVGPSTALLVNVSVPLFEAPDQNISLQPERRNGRPPVTRMAAYSVDKCRAHVCKYAVNIATGRYHWTLNSEERGRRRFRLPRRFVKIPRDGTGLGLSTW